VLLIALVFAAMLIGGRYIRTKAAEARAEEAAEAASRTNYRIRIATTNGAKPKRKDVTERYAIETKLESDRIARVLDTSIGDTYVEIVAAVREAEEGLRALRAVIESNGLAERTVIERLPVPGSN
jgi:hypothetical protein